jgi:hypothetical protein
MTNLPTAPRLAVEEINQYKFLIHSLSGMGKTCFINSIPNVLIIDTERGALAHKGFIVEVETWMDFCQLVQKICQKPRTHQFQVISIDTLDKLYDLAMPWVLQQMGTRDKKTYTHPGEMTHGIGYDRITTALFTQLDLLKLSGLGLVCTAHTMTAKVTIRGVEFDKFVPAFVGASARSCYQRAIDFFDYIGFLRLESMVRAPKDGDVKDLPMGSFVEAEKRVLDFSPSQWWIAKKRDALGRFTKPLPLPEDWREDWQTIMTEWNRPPLVDSISTPTPTLSEEKKENPA